MHVATVMRDNVKTWRIQPGHVWRHASRRIYIILNVFYNVNRASRVRRTQTLIRENTYFQLCSDETYKIHLDRFQSISNKSLKPLSKTLPTVMYVAFLNFRRGKLLCARHKHPPPPSSQSPCFSFPAWFSPAFTRLDRATRTATPVHGQYT